MCVYSFHANRQKKGRNEENVQLLANFSSFFPPKPKFHHQCCLFSRSSLFPFNIHTRCVCKLRNTCAEFKYVHAICSFRFYVLLVYFIFSAWRSFFSSFSIRPHRWIYRSTDIHFAEITQKTHREHILYTQTERQTERVNDEKERKRGMCKAPAKTQTHIKRILKLENTNRRRRKKKQT